MTHVNMCIERDFIDVPNIRIISGRMNKIKYNSVQLIEQFVYNV